METGSLKRQKVKTRLLGRAVVQQDWCPKKKRKLDHRQAQRDNHVRTQGEDNHLQAKEGDPKETDPGSIVILDCRPQKSEKISSCCLSPPVYVLLFWQLEQTNTDTETGGRTGDSPSPGRRGRPRLAERGRSARRPHRNLTSVSGASGTS